MIKTSNTLLTIGRATLLYTSTLENDDDDDKDNDDDDKENDDDDDLTMFFLFHGLTHALGRR